MALLRIVQQPGSASGSYRVAVEAEVPDRQHLSFTREIEFSLTADENERIRWYLEDYLQFIHEPGPKIAASVETLMRQRGEALFRSIFDGQASAIKLWATVEPQLKKTRVEIVTGIVEETAIPWELLRNPDTGAVLALSVESFVRAQPAEQTATALVPGEKVRILLVISRPGAGDDVPFRSVAGRLVSQLNEQDRETFQLDVLRPPTFERLAAELKLAKERGAPYHIVHFDGHGVFADLNQFEPNECFINGQLQGSGAPKAQGWLVFECPDSIARADYIDGSMLGKVFSDAGVPILILNACQSAFAEGSAMPRMDAAVHEETAAYCSLAQTVVQYGAVGVVAMRYSVYVVTAAQFVAELYTALARGWTLGEAVSFARRNLADKPGRKIAYDERPLQDWVVPIVWESTPLRLWAKKSDDVPLKVKLEDGAVAESLDPQLPARPYVGFFGRDETLYALDRAFDSQKIVLLHGYAGSGKTATAAEFARWYALTGGLEGPVLFSSFERHLPLVRALDKIGEIFGAMLERSRVPWDALDDKQRRDVALQMLQQVPVLWIWDNVEPVMGFPAGTQSEWSAEEQRELREFLLAARHTRAKFLLTSRHEERAWLAELPIRIAPPAMPMQERLQLAGAIAEHCGRRLAELPDLRPLLAFTQGNPLTILVVVPEALRTGINTDDRLATYIQELCNGEAKFQDEEAEGRSRSLGASLSYGFVAAFDERERKILALLYLFQGVVHVAVLMGVVKSDYGLDEVCELTHEQAVRLLGRASDIGLLTPLGRGYYRVHPALPWYFRKLFEEYFGAERGERAQRAFVWAMGHVARVYTKVSAGGENSALSFLAAEEDNLLAALRRAREHRWWSDGLEAMQGLQELYINTGRTIVWRRLVEATKPDFIDPLSDGPLPGREDCWSLFTDFRVRLARRAHDLMQAEQLQRKCVDWDRDHAREALAMQPESRDKVQWNDIRSLAVSLHRLGDIQRERDNPTCVTSYEQCLKIMESIGDRSVLTACAHALARAYMDITPIRDFALAERWLRQAFLSLPAGDNLGRGKIVSELGRLNRRRFDEAVQQKHPAEECMAILGDAEQDYQEALSLFPSTAYDSLANNHLEIAELYGCTGRTDLAFYHQQQAIRYFESIGDVYNAGTTRSRVAVNLLATRRFSDARAYAEMALANFRKLGNHAAGLIGPTELLLVRIAAAEDQHGEHA